MHDDVLPLFSVVIPTYNNGHYIGRAVQSVIDQTYPNLEIIIIDNHSNDNTDEVIYNFSDPRIKYSKIHNDGIIASSRNAGIAMANGEWVAFLDSDDWWHPEKLKECHGCSVKQFDVFYHDLEIIKRVNTRKKKYICSWQVKSPVQIDLLLRGNAMATSSVVVRRKILDQTSWFSENPLMVACEDYNLWLQLGEVTNKFYYCPKVLGYYMDDGNGMSSKTDMSLPCRFAVEPFLNKLSPLKKKRVEAMINYAKLRYAYLNGKYGLVIKYSFVTIKNGPLIMRLKSIVMAFFAALKYFGFHGAMKIKLICRGFSK